MTAANRHIYRIIPGSGKERGHIVLPDVGSKLYLNPIERTLLYLFLSHPEGIPSNDLVLHWEELCTLYERESCFDDADLRNDAIGAHDICKVRWHILGKDAVYESVFPMSTITPGHFADFIPIPRETYLKAMEILKNTSIDYTNRKRRILYLMKKFNYTDDEPFGSEKSFR